MGSTLLGFALVTLLGQDPDVPSLIRELQSDDISRRSAATSTLEKLGAQALKPLNAALEKTDDAEVRSRLTKIIGEIEVQHTRPGRLVFTRGAELQGELYLWENGETRRLTDNKSVEACPRFSPDGRRLVYFSMASTAATKNAEVVVMSLADKGVVRIGTGIEPAWSPDGEQIAFVNETEIHVAAASGKSDKVVFRSRSGVRGPSWSSDGKEIAFELGEEIWVVGLGDGKSRRVLGNIPNAPTLYNWSWSADGKRFALVAGSGPYLWDVYTIGVDGSELTKRTAKPWVGHGIVQWGPDSRRVAICVRLGSGAGPVDPEHGMLDTGLHLLDSTSGTFRKLAKDANPILIPHWSPDGKFIVYVTGKEEIWMVHVQTGASRKVTEMSVPDGAAEMWFPPSVYWPGK